MNAARIIVITIALCLNTATNAQEGVEDSGIAPQPLGSALQEFADKSGLQVIYVADLAEGKDTSGAEPNLSDTETLDQLLTSTGLEYEFLNAHTVTLQAVADEEVPSESGKFQTLRPVTIAQSQTSGEQSRAPQTTEAGSEDVENKPPFEEIIVTGTNIRGTVPVGAPVTVIDRVDIELSGASDIPQLARNLPQNFSGGVTEQTQTGAGGGPSAAFGIGGTGMNLRGLGNDATLTLINGHRFAATGIGNFFDISSIPLIAVDRIEILTDGASALYGADAVGGVVNIVLQDDFEGAVTRARYGTVTNGGLDELQFGQTFGTNWSEGGLFAALQYSDRGALFADERAYTQDVEDPRSLLPEQRNSAAFLNVEQHLSEKLDVFSSAFFSERRSSAERSSGGTARVFTSYSSQSSGYIGASLDIATTWNAEFVASFSRNETSSISIAPTSTSEEEIVSSGLIVDLKADGTLFALPGGHAKLALLGQFRSETFDDKFAFGSTEPVELDREILAFSSELYLPIVTEQNRKPGIWSLEATFAGRIERYSDFGTSVNPKFGLAYAPVEALRLRSTFGTSFLAPQLYQLNDRAGFSLLLVGPDPLSQTGTSVFYQRAGSNGQLDAEEATTWTIGFDYAPSFLTGLEASVTYFDIDFDNRIDIPAGAFATEALTRSDFAPFIIRDLTPDLIAGIQAGRLFNFSGLPQDEAEASAVAVFDSRLLNIASSRIDGIDFDVNYTFGTEFGRLTALAAGTYLLNNREQLLPELPVNDILNTKFNPIDLKLRGGLSLATGGFNGSVFVNYQDSYRNPDTMPESNIDSFTTVDLSLSYDFEDSGVLSDTLVQANVLNLLDEDPPFVFSSLGIHYDGANGTPLGRFVSIVLTKRWQ